ncbi:hypothetical protein HHK36_007256 [Tetracentron sinense]|uniref:Ribosomal protein L34e superfamily protein n=1 Tax=Tetracentron sinense TaxID=13715 RepID=A0A834ZIX9_TETSI|nr:hypothetical protein HHK36_007256 [Tetracentron sinense]
MTYFGSSISVCKPVDQSTNMGSPLNLTSNSRQNHPIYRNRKQPSSSSPIKVQTCHRSRTAAIDVLILIAVIGAFGFLLLPYIKLLCHGIVEIGGVTLCVVTEEVCEAPMIYASLGLSIFFATLAALGISKCLSAKCGNPNCRGLRNAPEFDIQVETKETVKNSISSSVKDDGERELFELTQDHHKELGVELRKLAPPNGRATLLFRAKCGCSVGRMEVQGPKKIRKIKK